MYLVLIHEILRHDEERPIHIRKTQATQPHEKGRVENGPVYLSRYFNNDLNLKLYLFSLDMNLATHYLRLIWNHFLTVAGYAATVSI
jgi:hypothetical protein